MKPILWTCSFLLLNFALHPSSSSQNAETGKKDSNVQHVELKEGRKIYWLFCFNASAVHDTFWRKDGVLLEAGNFYQKYLKLSCISKRDEGNYTCHNTSKTTGKQTFITYIVSIKREDQYYPCGKPDTEEMVQKFIMCPSITRTNYQCCNTFAPPPENVTLLGPTDHSYDMCNIYGSKDQPWRIKVNWKIPYYAKDDIWGWQIIIVGLDGDVNFQECIKINSKDKILNWNFTNVIAGATYRITVESLPSGYGDRGFKPNSVSKLISIPSWKDMCKSRGHTCKWEICIPVTNVTVTKQNTAAPIVSWRTSSFYKSQHLFQVNYRGKNCSDSGSKDVKNGTQVILNNLKLHKCNVYFVKVSPYFYDHYDKGFYGTESNEVLFYAKIPGTERNGIQKIVIACFIVVTVLIPTLSILGCIFIWRWRKPPGDTSVQIPPDQYSFLDNPVRVFIVYNSHNCKHCDDVVDNFGRVLNFGKIQCFMDMWTTQLRVKGCKWYEDMLKSCDIVLFMCAPKGQKLSNPYEFVKDMIMGQTLLQNIIQVITVRSDNSSSADIPIFLGGRLHFCFPSQIEQLYCTLSGGNHQNRYDYESRIPRNLVNALANSIEKAEGIHKTKKETSVRYLMPSTSSCELTS